MKVLKFGGSSVANAENIEKVIKIISDSIKESKCAVVFSAIQGVTDLLIETGQLAESGDESFRAKLTEIEEIHIEAIRNLIDISDRSEILHFVKKRSQELEKPRA